jgi:dihydroneopterin aldolase
MEIRQPQEQASKSQDEIQVTGMEFFGHHGYHHEEKVLGQKFIIDVQVRADLNGAGSSDNLEHTVDYGQLFQIAKSVAEGPSFNLIESIAEHICTKILALFPLIHEVTTTVHKPSVPIQGTLKETAVKIVRSRQQ